MHLLILSILSSVIVSIILKLIRRHNGDITIAVGFNYISALILSYFLLKPDLSAQHFSSPVIWVVFTALGILLPLIFIVMFKAVSHAGIVRADAAQRLSLFISIIAAFTLFGETLSGNRLISLMIAFMALFCLIYKPNNNSQQSNKAPLYLLGVWLGYGVIDILFKQLSKFGAAFSSGLFISFALSAIIIFAYAAFKKKPSNYLTQSTGNTKALALQQNILIGLILGAFNFSNIYFYIKAHQAFASNPTLVFSTMNIGVISLGTLVGAIIFKEKISLINAAGIILAIVAVGLLFGIV